MTSGYVPLGGVIVGGKALGMLETNSVWKLAHGFTYSGHHLACAAALACIEVTEEEGLLDRAAVLGERLRAGLQSLVDDGLYPVCAAPASCGRCTRPRAHTDRSAVGCA